MPKSSTPKPKSQGYCGVYQCQTKRRNGSPFFRLPRRVRQSPQLLRKWSKILLNGHPFTKTFTMCHLHFERNQYLQRICKRQGVRNKAFLCPTAFPTLNLPKFEKKTKILPKSLSEPVVRVTRKSNIHEEDPLNFENKTTVAVSENSNQILEDEHISSIDKSTYVNFHSSVAFSNLCDTDTKLKVMTGLENRTFLDYLTKECLKSKPHYNDNNNMSMRDNIILTMFKLKTNVDFSQLAAFLQMSEKDALQYFTYTIKILAKITSTSINLQSIEQITRSSPACFRSFPNFRLFVEVIEIKSSPSVKAVIGYAPSGLINYVSKAASGKFSDKATGIHSDLIKKLNPCDTIMVGNDCHFRDEINGVDVIAPGKAKLQDENILKVNVYFEKHSPVPRIRSFKFLSEPIESSLKPLVNDVVTVLCGLSNKSLCISIE
ncbi:uncharacterized protein LOC129917108 [Episyrphus balteatus]|uniref:uncharacterized protein LOC129917108 n=1 Tax=Episyrphus balteatus TaxID=286459 RepID=UPI0024850FEB|nr:uncharacterized protein LOC129917108 [Episyrphus balteatus]